MPATAEGAIEVNTPHSAPVPPATIPFLLGQNVNERDLFDSIHLSNRANSMLADSLYPSLKFSMTADGIFHLRIYGIIRAYGKYVDEITVKYFQGVHRWLPIISRSRFQDRLAVIPSCPAADFSILLLSMCLIIHNSVCYVLRIKPHTSNQSRKICFEGLIKALCIFVFLYRCRRNFCLL